MSRNKILALVFAGVFAVMGLGAGSASAQSAQPQAVQYTNVDRGSQSALGKNQLVIRDDNTWSAVWANHAGDSFTGGPKKPIIDFQKEMVIGVFLGTRPNLSYS